MTAMTPQEARASSAVVKGTIRISENIARVLFDPGTTHSFISSSFATKINKESELMNYQLVVSRGAKLSTNIYFRGCEIFIGEMRTQADLIQIGWNMISS